MLELWKPLPGYVGILEVSSMGRLRRVSTKHILSPYRHRDGYVEYNVRVNKRLVHIKAGRAVLLAFKPHADADNLHAAHLDGDRTNNRLSNLKWKTAVENEADKAKHGTKNTGERHGGCRITDADLALMREDRRTNLLSYRALAKKYNISPTHACSLVRGQWRREMTTERSRS